MDKSTRLFANRMLAENLACIQKYMADPLVEEIMINGEDNVWVIQSGHRMFKDEGLRITQGQILNIITLLANLDGKVLKAGTEHCLLDSQIEGFRFAAVLAPVSRPGHSLCIRKHARIHKNLFQLSEAGLFSPAPENIQIKHHAFPFSRQELMGGGEIWIQMLDWLVKTRRNIFLVGAPGCGKTTLLNALIERVPDSERVITIEDTREVQIRVPNFVSFEANRAIRLSIQDLVVMSLRYRPSRLVIGEVRSLEAYEMVSSMNTGLAGCMASFHANSALDALSRLERMSQGHPDFPDLQAFQNDLGQAKPYIVHLCEGADGARRIAQVIEVEHFDSQEKKYGIKTIFSGSGEHGHAAKVA